MPIAYLEKTTRDDTLTRLQGIFSALHSVGLTDDAAPQAAFQDIEQWYQQFMAQHAEDLQTFEYADKLWEALSSPRQDKTLWATEETWIAFGRLLRKLHYDNGALLSEQATDMVSRRELVATYLRSGNQFLWLNLGGLNEDLYLNPNPVVAALHETIDQFEPVIVLTFGPAGETTDLETVQHCLSKYAFLKAIYDYKQRKPERVAILGLPERMHNHFIFAVGNRALGFPIPMLSLEALHNEEQATRWMLCPSEDDAIRLEVCLVLHHLLAVSQDNAYWIV